MQANSSAQFNNSASANQPVKVDAAAFGAKFQSKREVYKFLTHDCRSYLPEYEAVTIYHMADLAAGRRKRIHQDDMGHITVPHYKGLTIEAMLEYAATRPTVMECLPSIAREREALPR